MPIAICFITSLNRVFSDRALKMHSTVTSKGQTTIPEQIRKALGIKPGDKLEYELEEDRATIRVHPGLRSLKGALASKKGNRMSFREIREAAAEAARPLTLWLKICQWLPLIRISGSLATFAWKLNSFSCYTILAN